MTDTVQDTVSRNNLYGGPFPKIKRGVTVAASQTLAKGCVVGLQAVEAGTLAGPTGTGDGVGSAFALAAGGPAKVGDYVATCIIAVANGGIFQVVDPDGIPIGLAIVGTAFIGGGITFLISDGSTDFIVGDYFTLPVAAGDGYAYALDHTAVDGSEVPYGVLEEAVTTGVAETQGAPVSISGEFQSQGLTFGGSTVYTDVIDAMQAKNLYVKVTDSDMNLSS